MAVRRDRHGSGPGERGVDEWLISAPSAPLITTWFDRLPIFESLIDQDTRGEYHQNHGQLAFALKDKRDPDWSRALKELNLAIKMRGNPAQYGFAMYEFNRVLCRIHLDANYDNLVKSEDHIAQLIRADLDVVDHSEWSDKPKKTDDIVKWIELNS